MKIETSHKKISSTILISMTDVIFLLLIFLMLASNFVTQSGINVRLPGSSSGNLQTLKMIEIILNKNNDVILNGIQMDLDNFKNILPTYFESEEQVVRLIADKEVALQDVVSVMDVIKLSGFDKITIATIKVPAQ